MEKMITIMDENYPEKLKIIKKPPEKLYLKGNITLLNEISMAIIGSRKHSVYGKEMAEKFALEISNCDLCIVSGMATGIDSIAHETCLKNGGKTIAVLPSGLNNVFPKENKKLFDDILENNGLIISEYEENTEASYNNFIQRNRIVSAISVGVLAIEAGIRSGVGITAQYAFEQNKKVFCIPSSLKNKNGIGTNKLIQKGAILTMCIDDILKEFNFIKNKKNKKLTIKKLNIEKELIEVYDFINKGKVHINDIYKNIDKNISEINYILTMLEIKGYIKSLPGKEFEKL